MLNVFAQFGPIAHGESIEPDTPSTPHRPAKMVRKSVFLGTAQRDNLLLQRIIKRWVPSPCSPRAVNRYPPRRCRDPITDGCWAQPLSPWDEAKADGYEQTVDQTEVREDITDASDDIGEGTCHLLPTRVCPVMVMGDTATCTCHDRMTMAGERKIVSNRRGVTHTTVTSDVYQEVPKIVLPTDQRKTVTDSMRGRSHVTAEESGHHRPETVMTTVHTNGNDSSRGNFADTCVGECPVNVATNMTRTKHVIGTRPVTAASTSRLSSMA